MVSLFAEPELIGANFNLCRRGAEAQIHVGMDYGDPAEAFGILCHEVWEMAMEDNASSFKPNAFIEDASDCRWFFFNHNQHTEISARASYFIWECMEDFKKAHSLCLNHKGKLK